MVSKPNYPKKIVIRNNSSDFNHKIQVSKWTSYNLVILSLIFPLISHPLTPVSVSLTPLVLQDAP